MKARRMGPVSAIGGCDAMPGLKCRIRSPLRKALGLYPVDALGEWTWVLVRPEDWKRILSERKFDLNNPAFSYLPKRETFFDGTLVVRSSIRGTELSATWHMPISDLLDLAIRHELAHALCNEYDEFKTDRIAIALEKGNPLSCGAPLVAESHTQGTKISSAPGSDRPEIRDVPPKP